MQRDDTQTEGVLESRGPAEDLIVYAVVHGIEYAGVVPETARSAGAHWCRIADETLVWAREDVWHRVEPELRERNAQTARGPMQVVRGRLYLVVQVGNEFLRSHPETRVALNKGRYLIVELTDDELEAIQDEEEACWGLRLLPADTVVLDTPARMARAPDPWVSSLVNTVTHASYSDYLTALTGYHTRHSLSSPYQSAAQWALSHLRSMGYDAEVRPIAIGPNPSCNVVAERRGMGTSRQVVVLTGHLDSVNTAGGQSAPAPGADDNGSGAAGVLEIARVLKDHRAEHDLRLILFGGEEQGLHGSRQYVAGLSAAERARVRAVINMDMEVGSTSDRS